MPRYGSPQRRCALATVLASAFAAAHAPVAAADNPAEALELPKVDVIGTTPLPGLGTPLKDVPANVQAYTSRDLARQRQTNLGEYLEQNPTGVTINSAQGNPFQPDISFRGFTASPLLGLAQGLSVFQDGVRINEPFGDIVNWDLIPQSAISSVQLIPGSNPAFGLNTLGGALAIYTKSGSDYPGGSAQAYGGSFGRRTIELEQGGKRGDWDVFVTGNLFEDGGWADHNPSRVRQGFGKVGYQTQTTDIDVSLTLADNKLQGTQTLPRSFLDNIRQAYTFPDININRLTFLTTKGSRFLSDQALLGGNAYYRQYRNASLASNANGNFGQVDPASGAVDTVQATNDRSTIDQDGVGGGLQLTWLGDVASKKNQFTAGAAADLGSARFTQVSQPAQFTANRATEGLGDFTLKTDAATVNRYYGLFFTDTLHLDKRWALTLSGRYNRAQIRIEDRSGSAPQLNGNHAFTRFNPAAGFNYAPTDRLTIYGSYNEGMRAPTPIELTCADPNAPCKLPNNFLADPDLRKVVSKTVETGARGKFESVQWSAALYRTDLDDDIQFVSSNGGGANAGFFQNVGKTRRQGVELAASKRWGALDVAAHYSYIDATYRSPFFERSPNNSTADASGTIRVEPGNHIAGVPQHTIKLRLDYAFDEQWSIGTNVIYNSAIFARGDENNRDANGRIPGYAVVNLDTRWQVAKSLSLFARIDNLFDRRYANFGILGQNFFTGPNRTYDGANPSTEQFVGEGAPRGLWIGLRYEWI